MLLENQAVTSDAVMKHKADMGIAWDGDFDRCFFFDEKGDFIEGYYLVGLLAVASLRTNPGAGIVHDPRLTWNTQDMVEKAGGRPIMNKTGHAFMKERMRAEDTVYGGEMSAHHYFREFAYCDSGMLPWLRIVQEMSATGSTLSDMVRAMDAHGWDGAWFRRAYDFFGDVVGSSENDEGKIFIEPQGMAVMAGIGLDDGRAEQALASTREHLGTPHGIVLVQPAFSQYHVHLGEISSYPPGYKENGGIFCHTNPWLMIAEARTGNGDGALDYYLRLSLIHI